MRAEPLALMLEALQLPTQRSEDPVEVKRAPSELAHVYPVEQWRKMAHLVVAPLRGCFRCRLKAWKVFRLRDGLHVLRLGQGLGAELLAVEPRERVRVRE